MGIDLVQVIATAGYVGIWAAIFAESGLLFGFLLPGDTLLLAVGLLAAQGHLDLAPLLISLPFAAILGDQAGYLIGKKAGPQLFSREQTFLFKRSSLLAAKRFYEKHGGKTVVFARFIAYIRTFAPIVAGATEMPYPRFLMFSLIGGPLWTISMTVAGYHFGHLVPHLGHYLVAVVLIFPAKVILFALARPLIARYRLGRSECPAE